MSYTNFKEAKKQANKVGGIVWKWVSYSVTKAKDWNDSIGTPLFVSKKAELFFVKKYKKSLKEKRKQMKSLIKQLKNENIVLNT